MQGEDTKEDFPLVLEDAEKQPKEGKPGASKSKGKKVSTGCRRSRGSS